MACVQSQQSNRYSHADSSRVRTSPTDTAHDDGVVEETGSNRWEYLQSMGNRSVERLLGRESSILGEETRVFVT